VQRLGKSAIQIGGDKAGYVEEVDTANRFSYRGFAAYVRKKTKAANNTSVGKLVAAALAAVLSIL
jgi:hypothetical protein